MKFFTQSALATLLFISITSCGTMMVLLGDNFAYKISGTVESSKNDEFLSNVKVQIDCKGIENSIYQDKTGKTGNDGRYEISGYWPLNKCEIIFEDDSYKTTVISIGENHLLKRDGMVFIYVVNAKMDPIESN
jgi:hypothetical protein